MGSRIHGIDDGHRSSTLKTFRRYGYDPRVGQITVKVHPDHVPEDIDARSLVVTPPCPNVELTLQENVLVLIFDGHHRYEVIFQLCNDNRPMFDWSRNPLPVYLTLR